MNTEVVPTIRCSVSKENDRGFSLVEVMLSLVLLTIVMLLTVKLMMSEIQGNHSGRSFTEATSVATDMVEKLMEVDYTDLPDFDDYNTTQAPPPLEPALTYCGEWRQWILNEIPSGYGEIDIQYGTNLSRIEVIVRFEDAGGEREVKLETMRNNVL